MYRAAAASQSSSEDQHKIHLIPSNHIAAFQTRNTNHLADIFIPLRLLVARSYQQNVQALIEVNLTSSSRIGSTGSSTLVVQKRFV